MTRRQIRNATTALLRNSNYATMDVEMLLARLTKYDRARELARREVRAQLRATRRERLRYRLHRLQAQRTPTMPYAPVPHPAPIHWETQSRVRYVTVYHTSREYGGPEEGGWWYDYTIPLLTYRVRNRAHAKRIALELSHRYGSNHPPRDYCSVLSTGVYRIGLDTTRHAHATQHIPRYE